MLTLIKSSFLEYKLTILRNKKTTNSLFRQTMNEISYLIACICSNAAYKNSWKRFIKNNRNRSYTPCGIGTDRRVY